jgi:hypothetical protein
MSRHDISLVSIFGLNGTLYVEKAGNAEGVSVQAEGPYETKVVDGSWLMIHPEDQEPQIPHRSRTDLTCGRTHIGSVDVAARMRWLTGSAARMRVRERYAKPAASAGLLGLRERSVQVVRAATSAGSCITRTFA